MDEQVFALVKELGGDIGGLAILFLVMLLKERKKDNKIKDDVVDLKETTIKRFDEVNDDMLTMLEKNASEHEKLEEKLSDMSFTVENFSTTNEMKTEAFKFRTKLQEKSKKALRKDLADLNLKLFLEFKTDKIIEFFYEECLYVALYYAKANKETNEGITKDDIANSIKSDSVSAMSLVQSKGIGLLGEDFIKTAYKYHEEKSFGYITKFIEYAIDNKKQKMLRLNELTEQFIDSAISDIKFLYDNYKKGNHVDVSKTNNELFRDKLSNK